MTGRLFGPYVWGRTKNEWELSKRIAEARIEDFESSMANPNILVNPDRNRKFMDEWSAEIHKSERALLAFEVGEIDK